MLSRWEKRAYRGGERNLRRVRRRGCMGRVRYRGLVTFRLLVWSLFIVGSDVCDLGVCMNELVWFGESRFQT